MRSESKRQATPPSLTTTLHIQLSSRGLEYLNAYRMAVHALEVGNWPDKAKMGSNPGAYCEYHQARRDAAAQSLAQFLSEQVDVLLDGAEENQHQVSGAAD